MALEKQNRLDEARATYRQALTVDSKYSDAQAALDRLGP
jgi:Flp pilus assembly protein TadD